MVPWNILTPGVVVELKGGELIKIDAKPDAAHVRVFHRIRRGWSRSAQLRSFSWIKERAVQIVPEPAVDPNRSVTVLEHLARELKRLEWSAGDNRCPRCGAQRSDGHAAECSLSDALDRAAVIR